MAYRQSAYAFIAGHMSSNRHSSGYSAGSGYSSRTSGRYISSTERSYSDSSIRGPSYTVKNGENPDLSSASTRSSFSYLPPSLFEVDLPPLVEFFGGGGKRSSRGYDNKTNDDNYKLRKCRLCGRMAFGDFCFNCSLGRGFGIAA